MTDWIRLDLHLHTRASWDCLSDPEAVLERALDRGIQRVAMTDHNHLGLSLEMHEKHPEMVIPGEEVRTKEGIDLIGLYIRTEIPKGTPAEAVCRQIREDGGVVYLPHPFAPGKGASGRHAKALAPLVDVVEVFNARLHPGRLNGPAEDLAREHGKLRGAGCPLHRGDRWGVGRGPLACEPTPGIADRPGPGGRVWKDHPVLGSSRLHLGEDSQSASRQSLKRP